MGKAWMQESSIDRLVAEAEADCRYHAEQQDVVNAWFERYRIGPVESLMRCERVPRWLAVAMVGGANRGLICVEAKP